MILVDEIGGRKIISPETGQRAIIKIGTNSPSHVLSPCLETCSEIADDVSSFQEDNLQFKEGEQSISNVKPQVEYQPVGANTPEYLGEIKYDSKRHVVTRSIHPLRSTFEMFIPKLVNIDAEQLLNPKFLEEDTAKKDTTVNMKSVEKLSGENSTRKNSKGWVTIQGAGRSEFSTTMMSTSGINWRSSSGKRPITNNGQIGNRGTSPTTSVRSDKPHLVRMFSSNSISLMQSDTCVRPNEKSKPLVLKVQRIPTSDAEEEEWTTNTPSNRLRGVFRQSSDSFLQLPTRGMSCRSLNKSSAKPAAFGRKEMSLKKKNKPECNRNEDTPLSALKSDLIGFFPQDTSSLKYKPRYALVELKQITRATEVPENEVDKTQREQATLAKARGQIRKTPPKMMKSISKAEGVRKKSELSQEVSGLLARSAATPTAKEVSVASHVSASSGISIAGEAFIKGMLSWESRLPREFHEPKKEAMKLATPLSSKNFQHGKMATTFDKYQQTFKPEKLKLVKRYPVVVDKSKLTLDPECIAEAWTDPNILASEASRMHFNIFRQYEQSVSGHQDSGSIMVSSSRQLTLGKLLAANRLWSEHAASLGVLVESRAVDSTSTANFSKGSELHPMLPMARLDDLSATKTQSTGVKLASSVVNQPKAKLASSTIQPLKVSLSEVGTPIYTPHFRSFAHSQSQLKETVEVSFAQPVDKLASLPRDLAKYNLFKVETGELTSSKSTQKKC
jgi:hypothetical protein